MIVLENMTCVILISWCFHVMTGDIKYCIVFPVKAADWFYPEHIPKRIWNVERD